MPPIITEDLALNVLMAGRFSGIAEDQLRDVSQLLDDIAVSFITGIALTQKRDAKKRVRKKMGKALRERLFQDLAGLWVDLPGIVTVPGITVAYDGGVTGRFVEFVQAFCLGLAVHLEAQATPDDWRYVAGDLKSIATSASGEPIREGLKLTPVAAIKRIAKSF